MNSYERRIIHTKLAEWKDVETISEGEGQERSLIIKPKRNNEESIKCFTSNNYRSDIL